MCLDALSRVPSSQGQIAAHKACVASKLTTLILLKAFDLFLMGSWTNSSFQKVQDTLSRVHPHPPAWSETLESSWAGITYLFIVGFFITEILTWFSL